nr:zinc finger, CCHC-type [Tanacetum cinerariifolium]
MVKSMTINRVQSKTINKAVEIYDLLDALHSCKQASGKSVSAHVLEMKGYTDQLHALGKSYDNDMVINLINRSINKDFGDFVRNFNMHCVGKTVTELHTLLIDYEKGLKDKAPTPQVLTIQKDWENKPKPDLKRKGNYLMVNNICKWAMVHKQQLKP